MNLVYNGTALQTGNVYINPRLPIYIVQGTAGALIKEKFVEPPPEWSAVKFARYGYGSIDILSI